MVAFIDQRELSVLRQALKAMRDCINLKREIGLPALPETRQPIDELEGMIVSVKLELLRSPHPEQLMLPGMPDDPLAWCEDSAQPNTQRTEGGWNEIPSRSPWRLAD